MGCRALTGRGAQAPGRVVARKETLTPPPGRKARNRSHTGCGAIHRAGGHTVNEHERAAIRVIRHVMAFLQLPLVV